MGHMNHSLLHLASLLVHYLQFSTVVYGLPPIDPLHDGALFERNTGTRELANLFEMKQSLQGFRQEDRPKN
jgi:hypothetical protein